MRRLLVICALAVMVFAAIAVVQRESSQAATTTSNLTLTAPAPSGCPLGSSYTFCNQLAPGGVGSSSGFAFFTVTNTSATAVNNIVSSVAAVAGQSGNFTAGDFQANPGTCGATLAPSASCSISVGFSPQAAGLRQAAITVKDTQGDSATLNVAGTASKLAIISPGSPVGCTSDNASTFCGIVPGGISAATPFRVFSNSVVTGVTIAIAAVPGLASEFNALDFTENSTCGASISPGPFCTINIQFTPTVASTGVRAAELNVTDAQGDAVTILLAGYVSSAGNTTSNLTLTPSGTPLACAFGNPFGYCNTPIGGTSATQAFTLTNTSGSSVTGIKIPFPVIPTPPAVAVPTDFTVTSSSCSATLLANTSCTINVAFTPTAVGLRQGSITVTDAQGDVGMINLTGYGDDFQLQIPSGQPAEVTVIPGGTATFKGQVVSDGVFGAQGEQVSFGCPSNLPTLTTCAFNPCPVAVTPGTPVGFTIMFGTSSPLVTALPPKGGVCPGTMAATMIVYMPKSPQSPRSTPGTGFASVTWLFDAAGIGIMALLAAGFAAPARRRTVYVLGFAIVAATVLAGCHHNGPVGGTPTGMTTMIIQGQALDANGNPLNTSRPMPQIILDVETN